MTVLTTDPLLFVRAEKDRLGDDLLILAHHYQRDEIVSAAHEVGDSLELARLAARAEARRIVFCGVHFMAESADILTDSNQSVCIPHPRAGCPLADMATGAHMARAYELLTGDGGAKPVVPVTYINSSADTKAFCGRMGGAVCTSSNAQDVMAWALDQGGKVLFVPDRNLGLNTARAIGVPPDEVVVWNANWESGGFGSEELQRSRVIVWNGYCHVHTYFTTDHLERARKKHPDCRIVVHPECDPEIVAGSDASGSTGMIVRYVEDSDPGSVIVVGTEIHLVRRIARSYTDRIVLPLAPSECPDMARTTLRCLATVLPDPDRGLVRVEAAVASDAKQALERMLTIGAPTR